MANGRLAYKPISRHPKTAAATVAVKLGSRGMPAALRMAGFTTTMYDIVANVVSPATTSREKVVLFFANSKNADTSLMGCEASVSGWYPGKPDIRKANDRYRNSCLTETELLCGQDSLGSTNGW